jgi:hypothetical protein
MGLDSRRRKGFSLHGYIQTGLGHTLLLSLGYQGSFLDVKEPEREAGHSLASGDEVKNA